MFRQLRVAAGACQCSVSQQELLQGWQACTETLQVCSESVGLAESFAYSEVSVNEPWFAAGTMQPGALIAKRVLLIYVTCLVVAHRSEFVEPTLPYFEWIFAIALQKVWLQLEEKQIPYVIEKINMRCYGDKPAAYTAKVEICTSLLLLQLALHVMLVPLG